MIKLKNREKSKELTENKQDEKQRKIGTIICCKGKVIYMQCISIKTTCIFFTLYILEPTCQ